MECLCAGPVRVRVGSVIRKVPEHGTRARYVHRTLRCRCPACTRANTDYIRRRRVAIARAEPWQPRTWTQLTLPGT